MQHKITWRSKQKDPSMENWITMKIPKVEELLTKTDDDTALLEITVDDGQRKKWKTTMNLKFHGQNFYSDTESSHFVKALDNTVAEIMRQLKDFIQKLRDKRRRATPEEPIMQEIAEKSLETEEKGPYDEYV